MTANADVIEVVAAVIVRDGLILCAQRGPGGQLAGKWEFPGGKIEPGETQTGALLRELREELGCQPHIGPHLTTVEHTYDFGTVRLSLYYATLGREEPYPQEHSQLLWVHPDELPGLDWAPADIPVLELIRADSRQEIASSPHS